jgi:hypothetical protein
MAVSGFGHADAPEYEDVVAAAHQLVDVAGESALHAGKARQPRMQFPVD